MFTPTQKPEKRSISKLTIILLSILVVLMVTIALVLWRQPIFSIFHDEVQLARFIHQLGRWAPLVTILLHIAQVLFAPIPGQALDIVNGYLFGPWLGTLFSIIGLGIGSVLAMWLARRFGRPLVERFVEPKILARLDGFSQQRGALFVFLIFLFPFLPDDAVCFIAGLTPIPLIELVLLAVVGRLPGVFVANWVGASTVGFSPVHWFVLGVVTLVVGVVFWRYREHIEGGLLNLVDWISG